MSEDGKGRVISDQERQLYYGTFQGVANYYPPPPQPPTQPVVGVPQPVPPPGFTGDSQYNQPQHPHPYGYQTVQVPGYAVVEGRPIREPRRCCCGLGMGWVLFIIGFFLGGIPWYIGAFILLCVQVDRREKPGYVACTVASILAMIAIMLGVTQGSHGRRH